MMRLSVSPASTEIQIISLSFYSWRLGELLNHRANVTSPTRKYIVAENKLVLGFVDIETLHTTYIESYELEHSQLPARVQ
ncbi:hypothetical protein CCR75_002484 [Bremia lactucae]|uniref:Uncharacterized protein n=1 Tax=Bremia lactucae TaxID=4779 RepID=A0A976FRI3_BRELC|nr:hypothetical protein CCR75_002484 [Bremia lactucae]